MNPPPHIVFDRGVETPAGALPAQSELERQISDLNIELNRWIGYAANGGSAYSHLMVTAVGSRRDYAMFQLRKYYSHR